MSDRSARGDKKGGGAAGGREVPALAPAVEEVPITALPAGAPDSDSVPMQVAALSMDPITSMPIVILSAPGEGGMPYRLSISIGLVEASAIASELEEVRLERPMTHDLMRNLLVQSGVMVRAVDICDLRDGVYYASITLDRDGRVTRVDSRPSDAIALALRVRVPVRVARRLIALPGLSSSSAGARPRRRRRKLATGSQLLPPVNGRPIVTSAPPEPAPPEPMPEPELGPEEGDGDGETELEELSRISAELLASLSDEDFGKWKM